VTIAPANEKIHPEILGQEIYSLVAELYPICRSITGNGVRETLNRLQKYIPLTIQEVPTGTPVFDWTVPPEWNIRDAYVKNSLGERVIDFQKSNLHVVSYSVPIREKMRLAELKSHLFTIPEHPDWIPYRTSYYKRNWGFCLSHEQFLELAEDEYEVCIDASLEDGHLTYGEVYLPGDTTDEILISSHTCHPSLANDNLSGVAVACFLAKYMSQISHRYSYRFLFIPGTIGSITWLCLNESKLDRIKHGLVLAGVGDAGPLSYKKSRRGDTLIDRATEHVLRHIDASCVVTSFSPYGYDERQYCSPGLNLAVGRLSRSPHGQFPEYHTSADNLEFVRQESLEAALRACLDIFFVLENNGLYQNQSPKCEPQLGKRGLYGAIGGSADSGQREMSMLWTLNLSDGRHSLLDIAERSDLPFKKVFETARILVEHGLLRQESYSGHLVPMEFNCKERQP
jgi:aminopeptidase-like protein